MTREPEWCRSDVNLMLALERVEAETNRFGIPLSVATAAENQYKFVVAGMPTVDWSEWALSLAQKKYYAADTAEHPMDRSGHLWAPPHLKT